MYLFYRRKRSLKPNKRFFQTTVVDSLRSNIRQTAKSSNFVTHKSVKEVNPKRRRQELVQSDARKSADHVGYTTDDVTSKDKLHNNPSYKYKRTDGCQPSSSPTSDSYGYKTIRDNNRTNNSYRNPKIKASKPP